MRPGRGPAARTPRAGRVAERLGRDGHSERLEHPVEAGFTGEDGGDGGLEAVPAQPVELFGVGQRGRRRERSALLEHPGRTRTEGHPTLAPLTPPTPGVWCRRPPIESDPM
ncbi:hypothetical protein GCM10017752_52580 [Streptomyces roseoviridis]